MKEETANALAEVCEGLLNFIASPKPDEAARSKAIGALVALRDQLQEEVE